VSSFPPLEHIAKKRKKLGLTQKQLAKLAGISQSLIAKVESKKISPSYLKVKAIFDVLDSLERKNDLRARGIMSSNVVSIDKDAPVSKAIQLMREHDFSQIPVFDGKKVVGSIEEKTILNQMTKMDNPMELVNISIERIMDESFPLIDEGTPLSIILALFKYYSAVLVSQKGNIIGIITKADLFKTVT